MINWLLIFLFFWPLYFVSSNCQVNCQNYVIQLLLDMGANIDKLNCEGMSALAVCHVLYYPFQSLHTILAEPPAKTQVRFYLFLFLKLGFLITSISVVRKCKHCLEKVDKTLLKQDVIICSSFLTYIHLKNMLQKGWDGALKDWESCGMLQKHLFGTFTG